MLFKETKIYLKENIIYFRGFPILDAACGLQIFFPFSDQGDAISDLDRINDVRTIF
jgi:hypothetical protein